MKIRFICDCCDCVFEEREAMDKNRIDNDQPLTGENLRDIMIQETDGDEIYVSSTCQECIDELGLGGVDSMVVYRQPLIH